MVTVITVACELLLVVRKGELFQLRPVLVTVVTVVVCELGRVQGYRRAWKNREKLHVGASGCGV